MSDNPLIDISIRPRVLIADDSRIVRATLIKQIEGIFEFREAFDGEEAWETLLIDPNIRVVITDLTMPKLDGYALLRRIRASKIGRIRTIPVVVVSGSDEQEEREKAMQAGATDLIIKGIGTAQLLSRLDILSKLVNTQRDFERSLETLVQNMPTLPVIELSTPSVLQLEAQTMLVNAVRSGKNFVVLNVCVGLRHTSLAGSVAVPPTAVVDAVGQLLQRTIRQTDRVAKTGGSEFTLVTGNIHHDSARHFASRICGAIAHASLVKDESMSFIASCGMAALSEYRIGGEGSEPILAEVRELAHRRAILGLSRVCSGVVGAEEEHDFQTTTELAQIKINDAKPTATAAPQIELAADPTSPDITTLLQWIKEGKQEQVYPYMENLAPGLKSLIGLVLERAKR